MSAAGADDGKRPDGRAYWTERSRDDLAQGVPAWPGPGRFIIEDLTEDESDAFEAASAGTSDI